MLGIDGSLLSWLILLGVGGLFLTAAGVVLVRVARARQAMKAQLQTQAEELERLKVSTDDRTAE